MTRTLVIVLLLSFLPPASGLAQDHLTLAEAQRRARTGRETRMADLTARETQEQVAVARAGYLPRVDLSEAWQRGDQPVFAFGALLSQRRFSAADFDIAALNHPAAIDNWRSAFSIEQTVFDAALRPAMRAAELGRDAANLARRDTSLRLSASTVEAYGRVLLFEALSRATEAAVLAAEEDVVRARNRRDAGVATDADVLIVDVHRAEMRQRQLQMAAEESVARGRLNDLIGAPLDEAFVLDPMSVGDAPAGTPGDLEQVALGARPDIQIARVTSQIASAALASARASFLPTVVVRGATEWNGASPGTGATGWVVGAEARVNLFRGGADRARLASARAVAERRDIERDGAESRARLEVRAALARRASAAARIDVAAAAIEQAHETQRIVRDRYDNGLADIVAVLRAGQAVLDAEAQVIGARADLAMQHAALDLALGADTVAGLAGKERP